MKNSIIIFCFLIINFLFTESLFSQSKKTDNKLVEELISKKRIFNKQFGFGFRIQLYNGFELEAKKIKTKFMEDFPEIKSFIFYSQPEWKIQVGFYKTKLEADRSILNFKKKYPSAIVIPLGK
tara:strand:- start:6150 stop:6518 length:369 start_codon:yes stop_codon:yes gene_type:complete